MHNDLPENKLPPTSKFEKELMKISSNPNLSEGNKQARMRQLWAKNGKRVCYVPATNPEITNTKGEKLGAMFLKATGIKWEDATPAERKAFVFPNSNIETDSSLLDDVHGLKSDEFEQDRLYVSSDKKAKDLI